MHKVNYTHPHSHIQKTYLTDLIGHMIFATYISYNPIYTYNLLHIK